MKILQSMSLPTESTRLVATNKKTDSIRLLATAGILAIVGCTSESGTGAQATPKYGVIKLNFANIKTADQASAFFGAQPASHEGDSYTWEVASGLNMTFQISGDGFVKSGDETHPTPTFDPAISDMSQAESAFARKADRTINNKALEMTVASYAVNDHYEISFGFNNDGSTSVLFSGSDLAKAAVEQL